MLLYIIYQNLKNINMWDMHVILKVNIYSLCELTKLNIK